MPPRPDAGPAAGPDGPAASSDATRDPRRAVPRTDALLAHPALAAPQQRLGRPLVRAAVGRAQQEVRQGTLSADPSAVVESVIADLPATASSLRPVLNATGVLLHTNVGRAALSQAAVRAVVDASGACDVELDLATGRRAPRGRSAMAALATAVPDAEAVHVVTNGAAALVLAATALATDRHGTRDVVMSRGEMVEVGNGFRLHELVTSTGARLREVGTTNRTTARDVAAALEDARAEGRQVGLVLKVHPSNFRVEGFTAAPTTAELAAVCRPAGVPLLVDIGSGLLAAHPALPDEPDAATALRAGADLVTASGDKLLGGPQAGLLLGRADLVERLRRHPLARALRVGKLTLAALEATLAGPPPPVVTALETDAAALHDRAERLAAAVQEAAGLGTHAVASDSFAHAVASDSFAHAVASDSVAHAVASDSVVGGGGAPGVVLPSAAVSLPARLATPLRTPTAPGVLPVLARVEGGRCLLDLRAVPASADDALLAAVLAALATTTAATGPPAPVET